MFFNNINLKGTKFMYILGTTILASGLFFVAGQIAAYNSADSVQQSLVNLANYDLAVVAQVDPSCAIVCDKVSDQDTLMLCVDCIANLYTTDLSGDEYPYIYS